MSLNRSVLVGRLVRDGELRYTPSGVATYTFTIAVNRGFKKQGEREEVDYIPIVTWRTLAESCANHISKGRLVGVEGRIQTRNYEKDNRKIYVTEIIADNVSFLDSAGKTPDDDELPPFM